MWNSVICEKCNEKMPARANYCMNCGSPVGENLAKIKQKELEEQELARQAAEAEQKRRDMMLRKMNSVGNMIMRAQLDADMADQNQGSGAGGVEQFMARMGFKKNENFVEKDPFDMLEARPQSRPEARPVQKNRPELTDEQRAANEARMMRQMEMMNQRRMASHDE